MGKFFDAVGGSSFVGEIMGEFFKKAPKKKICRSNFKSYMDVSYLKGAVHTILTLKDELKRAKEEEWTFEEVQGALDILFEKAWNDLCSTPTGAYHFGKISIEEIINAENPHALLIKKSRGVIIRTKRNA